MTTVAYTGGTFTLLHPGHVWFLAQCRRIVGERGRVVVALNTDEFVESYKGARPVQTYAERKMMLEACRYVDEVIENTGGADSKPTIEATEPDFVVIGSDWACRDYYAQMQFTPEWLDERDITLIYVDRGLLANSTTELVGRIRG